MKIIDKIKIKIKEHQYNKYIEKHKENVDKAAWEMIESQQLNEFFLDEELCYQFLQRIKEHDNSKYSEEEYDAYRKYYYPISKNEKIFAEKEFQKAWKHHYENNDHHWENRQYKTSFNPRDNKDILPLLENIADWIAMGYQYNNRPYEYFTKHEDEIKLCPEEKAYMKKLIFERIDKKYIKKG